jgi:hypothetical protein
MKSLHLSSILILTLTIICLFPACRSDELQGQMSLEGSWDIVRQTTFYGEFSPTSFNATETVTSSGGGNFNFTQSSVSYMYGRDSTTYIGTGEWSMEMEKVREGFFRSNQFTLNFDNKYWFEVTFGDDTHNSEKDATTATFMEVPVEETDILVLMSLRKR